MRSWSNPNPDVEAEIGGNEVFAKHYLTAPFCVCCLVATLIVQMHFLNVGLAAFEVTFWPSGQG